MSKTPMRRVVEIRAVVHLDPHLDEDSARLMAKGFELVVTDALRGFSRTVQVSTRTEAAT